MLIYPVELTPDDNDTLLVTFPDVPEAVTFGEDEAEALLMAEDALLVMFSAYMDDHQRIPEPSPLNRRPGVALKVTASAKIALYNALLAAGKRKPDLARMLNLTAIQVDHLLSLYHKTRIEQIETALAVLGKRLIVEMREAA